MNYFFKNIVQIQKYDDFEYDFILLGLTEKVAIKIHKLKKKKKRNLLTVEEVYNIFKYKNFEDFWFFNKEKNVILLRKKKTME